MTAPSEVLAAPPQPPHAASSPRLTASRTFPANRDRASAFRTSSVVADRTVTGNGWTSRQPRAIFA